MIAEGSIRHVSSQRARMSSLRRSRQSSLICSPDPLATESEFAKHRSSVD